MFLLSRTISVCLGFFLIAGLDYVLADLPQEAPARENILDRFKVSREHDDLLLPVKVKGKNYLFLLDTAATSSVYDASFLSMLGDPIRLDNIAVKIHTLGGVKNGLSFFRSPAARLGSIDLLPGCPVLCIDLEKWRKLSKNEIYGILGMDFLQEHVFQIDFDNGEVIFLRSVGPDPGTRIPVSLIYNVPHVEVTVPGLQMREKFLVDTGLSSDDSGVLREALYDMLAERDVLTHAGYSRFVTAFGLRSDKMGIVNEISLEDFRHEKVIFTRSNLSSLGLNYWSRYVVTFDFRNKAIYLKKGRRFNQADLLDRSGLHILWEKGQTLVHSVDDGSPAAQAGIKPQDALLKIDDVNSSEMSLTRIRRLFCEKDREYRLLIQRGENKLELNLHLCEKQEGKSRK